MKRALKEAWVTALRSDEFPQARGLLHRLYDENGNEAEGFCCLGVLCEVAIREGLTVEKDDIGDRIEYRNSAADYYDYWSDGDLNIDLIELFGLEHDAQTVLINMNDGSGEVWLDNPQDFGVIADWIDENIDPED